jgi:hypothetical protein
MTSTIYKFAIGAALSLSFLGTASAAQTVVDFEDVYSGPFEGSYKGMTGWYDIGHVRSSDSDYGEGNYHFQGFGGTLTFDNAPVVFKSMLYNIWAATGIVPTYDLYYKDQLVYAATVDAEKQPLVGLYLVTSGYSGLVDRIHLYGTSDGFVVDNFTYAAAPVPEPESWLMLMAGLGAMAGYLRRKK